ncbi:MAG: carboxypeptidase-like regulatory domain-containing protein, partial [Flavobacterium sp.]
MKKIVYLFLLLLCSFNMFAASRIITGVVTESEMPLPGVTVTEKGTQTGTQTDLDGKYRITIDDSKPVVLVFSFIGMKEEEVRVGVRNVYNVVLKADDVQLDEVVVMGYADAKMINHIEEAPVAYRSSSYRELQGNVAGLKIQVGNSKPEGSTETWKKSTLKDNSMRLEIGDNEFLPLEDAQIAMQVDGNRIRVLIDAYFYNDKRSGLEGTFKLKLPVDASPYYFAFGGTTMFDKDAKGKNATPLAKLHDYTKDNFDLSSVGIQKREDQKSIKQARITEKQTAADAYFSTINRKVDPALMEWSGADMFSCRVFPLEANQLHHIVVGYDVDMVEGVDFREFVLSLPEVKNKLRLDMAVADNNQYVINPVKDAIVEKNNQKQYLTYFNPKVKEINVKL